MGQEFELAREVAPATDEHVDALHVEERERLAGIILARFPLAEWVVDKLVAEEQATRDVLIGARYMAALTPEHRTLGTLDLAIVNAAAGGELAGLAARLRPLAGEHLLAVAVELLDGESGLDALR